MWNMNIIPIESRGKKSLISWKAYQQQKATLEEVEHWKAKFPDCNWGLVTGRISGVMVLDFDSQEGYDFAKANGLPAAPTVKTKRAFHVYLKYKEGVPCLQSVAGRKDIQLKSEGGYVLIPPSIHASGAVYQWVEGKGFNDIDLPDCPGWVYSKGIVANTNTLKDLYKGVSEGGRNNALAKLAGSMANDGVDVADAINHFLTWNERNSPPMSENDVRRTVESIYTGHYKRHPESVDEEELTPPDEINDLLKKEIPPVQYIIENIIQKFGRTMISASPNKGKTLIAQNLAIAMTAPLKSLVLGKFQAQIVRVLYLDFEVGLSVVRDRFQRMLLDDPIGATQLFAKSVLGKDLLDEEFQRVLEGWLQDHRIDVLIIDTIGSAWTGDENNKTEVARLTSYLDSLIVRFNISIVFTHHWRKASKFQTTGGQMAAGSYKFTAWVDIHLPIEGEANNLTISWDKARTFAKLPPMRAGLDVETMTFKYLGNCEKKYTEETLIQLYSGMGKEWIAIPDLIEESKKRDSAGKDVIRALIKSSAKFDIDTSSKTHKIRLKPEIVTNVSS